MGENLRKRIQRRRAQAIRKGRAVSPVVATLILILIAVAAAAALYLWLVTWQGSVTGQIGNTGPQATVTIGGSTSVYPFEQAAVNQFEQNQTDIAISVNQGGTGAGMLAVCHGSVDIGAASTYETVTGLETTDQCPSTTVINTIAWDAVDVIVPTANVHQLQSISWDTLTAIYDGASSSTPTLLAPSIDGQTISTTAILDVAPWSTHAALAWDQIPACVFGATVCGGVTTAGALPISLATTVGAGAACAGNPGLLCENAGASPCGFTVCAGGATLAEQTATITTVARSDASGTTQTFEARLLGATSATGFATTPAGLGFSGCGSNNILADCGIATPVTGNGNPGVITAVGGNANSIGYASDGLARATGSGVLFLPFLGTGQVAGAGTGYSNGAVNPSLGTTGTISLGAQLEQGTALTVSDIYAGVRPFQWVTTNTPTGEVQQLLTWVLDPANNINVAADTAEVSIYSI
jgi:flagellin-like protein